MLNVKYLYTWLNLYHCETFNITIGSIWKAALIAISISRDFAGNQEVLKELGITHILNAAQGKKFGQVNTTAQDYEDLAITFYGVPAIDIFTYKIKPHFKKAAQFINNALTSDGMHFIWSR